MTVGKCKRLCFGFAYAGVQYSKQCFCGNTAPSIAAKNCNMACAGNKKQTCGGDWAMNVYSTLSSPCKYILFEFMIIVFTKKALF